MKSTVCLAIAILFLVTGLAAQTAVEKPDWQQFTPQAEEFSVEVPLTLDVDTTKKGARVISQRYSGRVGNTFIFIFSDDPMDGEMHKNVNRVVSTYLSKEVGKIPSEKFAAFSFGVDDGYFHNVALIRGDRKIYSFHTVSTKANDPVVKRFFRTLKIANLKVEGIETSDDDDSPVIAGTGTGSGSGLGTGSGSGSGSGSGDGTSTPAVPAETSALAITAKPKAAYTDVARFYGVTGSVQVRVTFGPDGRIGEVTTTKTLPFGLTANAIKAAKEMRFRPAVRGGKPVAISRLVEYSFSIY